MEQIAQRVWDGAGDSWQWLRGVVLGEWEDERSAGQIVADALAGFVPGLGSVITLRDLIAVIVRLARQPHRREEVEEWILLVAMLLPLILTVAGAAAAGIGALAGAELGGFLRAVALFIVKKGGVGLRALVEFFQAHGYGDVVQALRQIRFAPYRDALIHGLGQQIDKLVRLVRGIESRLKALSPHDLPAWLPGREALLRALAACPRLVDQLEALRRQALSMIPKALVEMDQRLGALLAGDIKAATQVTHTLTTGQAAPEVARLKLVDGQPVLRNSEAPEPGNTRRVAERRVVALDGRREYAVVGEGKRPVGAKPYEHGVTRLENPPCRREKWLVLRRKKLSEGWPDLTKEYRPGRYAKDYATFTELRPSSLRAGSDTRLKRVVSHDAKADANGGAFWNRKLPVDGEDLRAGSAVKDGWNKDGQYVELRVPGKGDPVWKELHALQEQAAKGPVVYDESLKFWEGPAASQVYEKELPDRSTIPDDWYLAGGKSQQFLDRDQMKLLQARGFITERKATGFPDFDPALGNIVPKEGPFFEVMPLAEAVPPPRQAQSNP